MLGSNIGSGTYAERVKRRVIEKRDDDWTVDHMGMLRCPCCEPVEDDGTCPNGHESPLKDLGLI